MVGEEEVVELVDFFEVVGGGAGGVFGVEAHLVGQDAVEAEVVEADLGLEGGELGLPVGAEAFGGASGSDGDEGDLGVRAEGFGGVGGDLPGWDRRLGRQNGG